MRRPTHSQTGSENGKDWQQAQAPDFKAVSPLFHPEQFSIPMPIVHGKKDQVVPYSQSKLMAGRLKHAGKPVEFVTQPLGATISPAPRSGWNS